MMYTKALIKKPYGVGIVIAPKELKDIPLDVGLYEPTPENARKLLQEYFPFGWRAEHDKEVVQLAYTSPEGAKRIYGDEW